MAHLQSRSVIRGICVFVMPAILQRSHSTLRASNKAHRSANGWFHGSRTDVPMTELPNENLQISLFSLI